MASRRKPATVWQDAKQIAQRVVGGAGRRRVVSVTGKVIKMRTDTRVACHGDTPAGRYRTAASGRR